MNAPDAPEEPILTDAEVLAADLRLNVLQVLSIIKRDNPDAQTDMAMTEVLRHVIAAAGGVMGPGPMRAALLEAFEASHPKPMSFIDIGKAKDALKLLSDRRKAATGRPTLILPGEVN